VKTSDAHNRRLKPNERILAVILARLSTGVISLEPDWQVRTANRAASMILGEDIEARVGAAPRRDRGGGQANPRAAVCRRVPRTPRRGQAEWREQFVFQAAGLGRRS
jgi:nitrogen fixation/metabolism regulation signal transduction histidine kinase